MADIHADLRLWTGSETASEPADPQEIADHHFVREAFRSPPRAFSAEPYSLPWFEQIERQRYARQGYWLPKVLEFKRHAGEAVLGLGETLGTDWLQYARHGAQLIACSPTQDQVGMMRRNFELQGQAGRFLHAPPHALPLDASSIDVACIHGPPVNAAMIDEVYRVLRPGGKVIVVAQARYDADYWNDFFFPWRQWFGNRRAGSRERSEPAATGRGLRREFARFVEHRVYKRHLRRANLPPVWRFYPLPLMERLVGRLLILKAFKPLSAALAAAIALAA
ncbi:MAG TPA: class I SAM-dependent methyltransferase [Gemmataceae bacterium]|nr:class I SAM-dependent methyltransferase [Gemmataceae bacterium]